MPGYLFKMIVCSGILFLYYLWFLRNKKFHRYNRFYLLFAAGASFLIPFISIDFFIRSDNERIGRLVDLLSANRQAEQILLVDSGKPAFLSWQAMAFLLCALVSALLLVFVFIRIARILILKKKYAVKPVADIFFVDTDLPEAPFSFFRNLFWRQDISLEEEAGRHIFRHEMAHIEQRHSWDRIFMQIVKAVCWFNPVFYLIEKEITLIHEYIADEKAIANQDGRAFAAMLMRSRVDSFRYAPGEAIFYSSIKKRLQMLTNKQRTKYSYARRLLVLPLLGLLIFASGFNIKKAEAKETIKVLEAQVAKTQPATDSLPPLKGKVEGIVINNDTAKLLIHSTKPLIIVDGEALPADANLNDYIPDKSSIEAVNVLKDEHAIKKYGEKGKDGVVEITTKKNERTIEQGSEANNKTEVGVFVVPGGAEPLYVIDGKPSESSKLAKINRGDIEAIHVLKNKAATDKYGENGKNGVIEITTKKDISKPNENNQEEEFTVVEEPAAYPGDWQKFLAANLNSRIVLEKGGPPGMYRVTVSFRVDKDGNISQVNALNDPGYGTAAEAVKAFKASGRWLPARAKGQKVSSLHKQTITFVVE